MTNVDRYIATNVDDGDGHIVRAAIEAKLGNVAEARASALTALRHYEIVNDQDKAAQAQALLNALNATPSPSPSPSR